MAKSDLSVAPVEPTMMEKISDWLNSLFGSAKEKSQEVAGKAKELSEPIQESANNIITTTKHVTEEAIAKGKAIVGVEEARAPAPSPEQKMNSSTAVKVFVGVVAAVILAQTTAIVYTSMKGSKPSGGDAKPAAEAPAAPAAASRSLPTPAAAPAPAAAVDDLDEL